MHRIVHRIPSAERVPISIGTRSMQLLEVGSSKAANVFCWLKSLESQTAICGQQKAFTFRIHSVAFCIATKSDERSIHHGLTVLKNFSNTQHFWGLKQWHYR
jgi:hypothetical protein